MRVAEARERVQPFEHTGDLGIEVRGEDLERLLAAAAIGLTDTIVDAATVRPAEARDLRIEGEDRERLLHRLLQELVYVYDVERWLCAEAEIEVEAPVAPGQPLALRARLRGELLDPVRHEVKTELKAATYHGLEIAPEGAGLRARVIFDV